MPHIRQRQIEQIFKKRLKISRVVLLNGARQTGKSFFVRELLADSKIEVKYLSLDTANQYALAIQSPTQFLNQRDSADQVLAIDEAQKSPMLFNAVKEIVDINTRPGQFVLLGSTEFSHRTNIMESLTGRASPLTMYPFNVAEIKHLPLQSQLRFDVKAKPRVTLTDVLQYFERGGLPGIFSVRENDVRMQLLFDWIDLTVNRDLFQIKGTRFVPALARQVLEAVAQLDDSSATEVGRRLRISTQTATKYLSALQALFVVHEIPVFPGSTGKNQYVICDCGLGRALGATKQNILRAWFLNEILSQATYRGERFHTNVFTYRGSKGGRIDFVLKLKEEIIATCLFAFENLSYQDFEIMRAFKSKNSKAKLIALAPVGSAIRNDKIDVLPYEFIV